MRIDHGIIDNGPCYYIGLLFAHCSLRHFTTTQRSFLLQSFSILSDFSFPADSTTPRTSKKTKKKKVSPFAIYELRRSRIANSASRLSFWEDLASDSHGTRWLLCFGLVWFQLARESVFMLRNKVALLFFFLLLLLFSAFYLCELSHEHTGEMQTWPRHNEAAELRRVRNKPLQLAELLEVWTF